MTVMEAVIAKLVAAYAPANAVEPDPQNRISVYYGQFNNPTNRYAVVYSQAPRRVSSSLDGLSRDVTYGWTVIYAATRPNVAATSAFRTDWLVQTGQAALIDQYIEVDGKTLGPIQQVPWNNVDAAVDDKVADRPTVYVPDQYTLMV